MKDNAKKILLLSYSRDSLQPFTLTYEHIKLFLPDLTASGLRSLVVGLKQQGLIETERVLETTQIRITSQGKQTIEKIFPLLAQSEDNPGSSSREMVWSVLVFIKAPKGDKQFRYLRSLLVKYRAVSLSRGVYAYPFAFPTQVIQECHNRYSQSVIISEIKKWVIGDDRSIAINHFNVLDLIQSYSGISKDINRLIDRKKVFRELNDQEKRLLSSLFNQTYSNIQEDYGLIGVYFPTVESSFSILLQIQSLLA